MLKILLLKIQPAKNLLMACNIRGNKQLVKFGSVAASALKKADVSKGSFLCRF
jgi:hypothetical protein